MNNNKELIEKYERYMISRKKANNTISSYLNDISLFARQTGKDFVDIKLGDIDDWLYWLQTEKELSESTMNRRLKSLNGFYEYLLDREYITKNPFAKVEKFKEDKPQPDSFSEDEIENLRTALKYSTRNSQRNLAIFEIMLSCGLRIGEATSVTPKSFTNENGVYYVTVTGKGNKTRSVIMSEYVYNIVKPFIDKAGDGEKIFGIKPASFQTTFKKVMDKVLDRECKNSCHNLRSTFATRLARCGVNPSVIQHALGHSSLSVTSVYISTNEDDQFEIIKSLEKYNK